MARAATKKTAQRPRKKAAAASRRTTRPAARAPRTPRAAAETASTATKAGPVADLAGGMRTLLSAIENEVRAVSALSEQIDTLVTELNGRREDQAARLLALDALRGSVTDTGLNTFLDKAIRPRRTRVPEVIPERLTL
jgi:protoporphyrinogen oxidase